MPRLLLNADGDSLRNLFEVLGDGHAGQTSCPASAIPRLRASSWTLSVLRPCGELPKTLAGASMRPLRASRCKMSVLSVHLVAKTLLDSRDEHVLEVMDLTPAARSQLQPKRQMQNLIA